LLSGTPFGIGASSEGSVAPKGSNIWLSFELKGKENVTINFAHEVESKYGLSALNPRLAARKERQRQVALASSELEKAAGLVSADDMSIDQSEPESNNDTDVVMKDTEAPALGKRRKRKAEDYDRNDEFIDDAELLLEEQALMAKDGFFVYSGPLLEEGERPAIERFVLGILILTISSLTLLQSRRYCTTWSWSWPWRIYSWRNLRSRISRWWSRISRRHDR
jgi:hypothetical protein